MKTALAIVVIATSALLTFASLAHAKDSKPGRNTVRWAEGQPGCTFTRGEDGKYHYGLSSDDIGITVAVDSQELEKVHRRPTALFTVQLTVKYRGSGSLDVINNKWTLEFVKHAHQVHHSLDPDALSSQLQASVDDLIFVTNKQIKKHPEKKQEQETLLQNHAKAVQDMQQFLGKYSLRDTKLTAATTEINGWIYFSAQSKWIGEWKKPEQFILRIPLAHQVFEFPFQLPAEPGDLILRKR